MYGEWNDPKEDLDAVVLAGDRDAYKPVCEENKALLEIEGVPVICRVIAALQRCRYVTRIFVVGPKARIGQALERAESVAKGPKEIILLEQGHSLLENGWNAFLETLSPGKTDGKPLPEEALRVRYEGRVALFLAADMPLLTHYELEEFIEGCDMRRYDYVAGTTPEEALKPYYPQRGRPGIRMAYFHFKDSKERQNNLHMIRVFRVVNTRYAELMYRFRHQRKWQNILLLFRESLRLPELTPGMLFRFCLLHACRFLGRTPWIPLNRLWRGFLDKGRLEEDIGALLQTRFAMATTTYGGAAMDVDDKEQFSAIGSQFSRWCAFQEELHRRREEQRGASVNGKYSG